MAPANNNATLLIAPQYPPAINGLGDYAARLGQGLTNAGYTVHYAGLPQPTPVTVQPYWSLQANGTHLPQLVQQQQIHTVILNYSGYGYQRKGVPLWLVTALTKVKQMGVKILIFFHELYANGPLWTSAFWLHQAQKKIFKALYRLTDAAFCSNGRMAALITEATSDKGQKNTCIGLFSNIPEPNQLMRWEQKQPRLLVFGHPAMRLQTYEVLSQYTHHWLQLGISEIIDIGVSAEAMQIPQLPVPIKFLGVLTAEQISVELQQARFGAMVYPDALLGKSGVLAAYLSHGLFVWNGFKTAQRSEDGLVAGEHYWQLQKPVPNSVSLEKIAKQGSEWYYRHNYQQHLQHYLAFL
jgi:hypothetical protein